MIISFLNKASSVIWYSIKTAVIYQCTIL